ncbi:DUF2007 domain-containing protein [Aestuariivivens sediminicola]|uniref:DUF2007 domain-containing protein n=1 Tax=Aestuariivivens sediminicola TaxID=2913560 RepID=UPI001F591334|nr:DUF2007 domain-containing protein [Aestuariivivens sediminicola]
MADSNYTKIFTGNLVVSERIKQSLEELDINAIVREQNESGLNPIFGGHVLQDVFVHKDELDRALPIVETIKTEFEAQS